jgi:hypothetical protein
MSDEMPFPEGADRKLLEEAQQHALSERADRFAREHQAFMEQSQRAMQGLGPLTERLGVDRGALYNALIERRRTMFALVGRAEPHPAGAHEIKEGQMVSANDPIAYPQGADQELLQNLQRRSALDRERRFMDEHDSYISKSKQAEQALTPVADLSGIKREVAAQALAERRKQMQDFLRQQQPPPFQPLTGHNPAQYAPYSVTWNAINCGGITVCSLRGPNGGTGEEGADLGIFNAGGASSVASVGFWYYAQEAGTLWINVQALVWGRGYVFSGLFGYANAYCGLRAYIEQFSPTFQVYTATTDIYNVGGVLVFDITSFDWVTRSAWLAIPLVPQTWYRIWADDVQHAYAGGVADSVSNFDMYIGPIYYFRV